LEAGECIITSAAFSVRDMVDGVLSVCRMSLAHHNNAVIRWLDEDAALPALVLGDSDKLRRDSAGRRQQHTLRRSLRD
jgi:hypothetical protein